MLVRGHKKHLCMSLRTKGRTKENKNNEGEGITSREQFKTSFVTQSIEREVLLHMKSVHQVYLVEIRSVIHVL